MLICRGCKQEKPEALFYKNWNGNKTRCKACIANQYWANIKSKEGPEGILSHLGKGARSRAKREGMEHDLTTRELVDLWNAQGGRCAISGRFMTYEYGSGPKDNNVSIDRLDITRGYTKNNVQLVCKIVNIGRNTQTVADFIQLCKEIAEFNAG